MKSNLSLLVALRYFFSKKSQQAINVISFISAFGIMIVTAALVIVLSVFNGFEDLILRLYNTFDPDFKIEYKDGKNFLSNTINIAQLKSISGVQYVDEIVEESALVKYRDKQYIIRLKGVGPDFVKMTGIDSMMVEGRLLLQSGDSDYAVFGSGVAYNLNVNTEGYLNEVEIYGARRTTGGINEIDAVFNRRYIKPAGVFAIQQEFDARYVLVPIRFAREIFEYEGRLTSLEVKLKPGAKADEVEKEIEKLAGDKFEVKNRFEQHKLINKIMKSEKWAVFLILTFILTIAIFNVISSQTMLVIEKKKDISVFRSLGAEISLLRRIFLFEGMFITLAGAVSGLLIGIGICFLQIKFGLVQLGSSGSFVIDAYPVKLVLRDLLFVFLTVFFIGLLAAWYPSQRLIRKEMILAEDFK